MTTATQTSTTELEEMLSEIRRHTINNCLQVVARETLKERAKDISTYPDEYEFYFTLNDYCGAMEINLNHKQRSRVGRALTSWIELSGDIKLKKDPRGLTLYSSRYMNLFKPAIRQALGL